MEKIMAAFGQGFVQAEVLSENNAVKYRLSIAGSCTKSTIRPYVRLQNEAFGPQTFSQGVTTVEVDIKTRTIISTKNYIFDDNENSAVNQAFITYMETLLTNRLIILITDGKYKTSDKLTTWFHEHGSAAWPTKWDLNHFDMAYSAFYVSGLNTITAEHVLYNDGKTVEPVSANLDVVFDYFNDIGATGFPRRTIEYDQEAVANPGETEIIRLPISPGNIQVPLSDYGLVPGNTMYLKAQLFADDVLSSEQSVVELTVRWIDNEGSLVGRPTKLQTSDLNPNQWTSFEREVEIPDGAIFFTLYIYKSDGGLTGTPNGTGKARNIVFTEMSRPATPVMRSAEFGVNGIRMNNMIDNNVPEDLLLTLKDSKTDDRGIVTSAEFREF